MNQQEVCANFSAQQRRVHQLAVQAERRDIPRIQVAVKTQSAATIRDVVACGATYLGHNRVQELQATATDLRAAGIFDDVELHLIGNLQSNKVNHTLRHATGIDTLDRAAIIDRVAASLERLGEESEIARRNRDYLDVMIQVNISGEATKAGCDPEATVDLARQVATKQNLRLVGLMTIGPLTDDRAAIRAAYTRMSALREQVAAVPGCESCQELSMGMSADLPEAIGAGATIVRIGRAIFGER
ncbi:MAG: YggS family pyridoxal phosphate-dependent enzyme [Bowdeniella nasicola]|nr:YggS family pyridoxal phosphate-dependent enzyme [Bowdeniella nasicola]